MTLGYKIADADSAGVAGAGPALAGDFPGSIHPVRCSGEMSAL
jgi:hypothetical protein